MLPHNKHLNSSHWLSKINSVAKGSITPAFHARLTLATFSLGLASTILSGCATISSPSTTAPAGPANPSASGNWQFNLTPTSGGALFPFISGYVQENVSDASSSKFTLAELTADGTNHCFVGVNPIFATGSVSGAAFVLNSASINGQFLNINGTLNADSTQFTGSYSVQSGCASTSTGKVSGQQYALFTGTYKGSTSATPTQLLTLSLTQTPSGNGNGQFEIYGTLEAAGFSCFTTGTLAASDGEISGSNVQLTFATDDPAKATLTISGTINPGATFFNANSINVNGGSCAGSFGPALLMH